MLNDTQKRTIQAIVNVFETGRPAGNYAGVTFSSRDVGRLTYGRSQTTLAGGGLARLIGEYCNTTGAIEAQEFRPYLVRLQERDLSLDTDIPFRTLLVKAGGDPAMHRVQDQFFDRLYWNPAILAARHLGISTALGSGVVYDSFIHGAWSRLRDATLARLGPPAVAGTPAAPPPKTSATDERGWILEYLWLRREWLATHPNPLLRLAVYRMDTFLAIAAAGNWELSLPLEAHGVTISRSAISSSSPAP